jgi:DNA-binding sugar fermentation-stimulating protein
MREAVIADYKSDLFIKETNAIIEIKSILSFNKETMFPSMYSKRALKQLADIAELMDKGYKVCYIFVSPNSSVKSLTIDVTKTNYFDLFRKCIEKGMVCYGFSLKFNDGEPTINSRLHINLKACDTF